MVIIGCDYHPSMQQVAWVDTETGDCGERQLRNHNGEAEGFYRELRQAGKSARVGMEATGHARWFERLLAELQIELWIGNAAEIAKQRVRKQKTDRRDAQHLLRLLLEDRFPRLWVPGPENRDLRQLLWHRHRLVQMRTRIKNQLQTIALNEGVQRQGKLWSKTGRSQLESLPLPPWTARRREDLLTLLDQLTPHIEQLSRAIEYEGQQRPCRSESGQGYPAPAQLTASLALTNKNKTFPLERNGALHERCRGVCSSKALTEPTAS